MLHYYNNHANTTQKSALSGLLPEELHSFYHFYYIVLIPHVIFSSLPDWCVCFYLRSCPFASCRAVTMATTSINPVAFFTVTKTNTVPRRQQRVRTLVS